jgi:hypothetical protein
MTLLPSINLAAENPSKFFEGFRDPGVNAFRTNLHPTMKTLLVPLFSLCLLASPIVSAQSSPGHGHHGDKAGKSESAKGTLVAAKEVDAKWLADARKAYPLKACLTSDEPLGSMGDPSEFVYRVAGKADRLVVFCCEGCSDDFIAEPDVYLAKIDAAAKARGK